MIIIRDRPYPYICVGDNQFYFKQFALGNGETHPPTDQVAPNAVIVELGNTQYGTGTSTSRTAAATTSSIQLPPGPLLFEKEIGGHRYLYPSCIEEEECPTCLEGEHCCI